MADIIFVILGVVPYFCVTLYYTITAYKNKDKDEFKKVFPWFLLSFTICPPIFISMLVAVIGFVGGLVWFFTEWLPDKLFNRFTK
jgi:uncharacterized membrane protein YhdT